MTESQSVATKSIRDLDENTYLKFKCKCVELNKNMGKATTEAFKLWIEKNTC